MPTRIVSTSIDIAADPMAVWAILTDLTSYPEWNPHIRHGTGVVEPGNRLTLRMHPPRGRAVTIKPTVIAVKPGAELRLLARIPGVFIGEHRFHLSPCDRGTHLVQSEVYRGPLVWLIDKAIAAAQTSFVEHNQALKARAEGASPD